MSVEWRASVADAHSYRSLSLRALPRCQGPGSGRMGCARIARRVLRRRKSMSHRFGITFASMQVGPNNLGEVSCVDATVTSNRWGPSRVNATPVSPIAQSPLHARKSHKTQLANGVARTKMGARIQADAICVDATHVAHLIDVSLALKCAEHAENLALL